LRGLVGYLADPVVVGAVPDPLLELLTGQPDLAAQRQQPVGGQGAGSETAW
jgi:hypothetical protein